MLLIIVAIVAAAHAYMFGRWLIKTGNKNGAFVVYFIAVICVVLPVYRYMAAQ